LGDRSTVPTVTFYDVTFYAAVVFVLVALAVWITSLQQLLGWIGIDRSRIKAFLACVVLGTAYGAAFGSFYGPALWLPSPDGPLWAVSRGAVFGASLGAFGGGVAGFFGIVSGRHVGWWFAGVLGGAAPAACVWIVSGLAAGWEPVEFHSERILSDGLLVCSGIVLIGGCLGAAVDRALRSGRSIVPGVQRLAAIINGVNRPEYVP
jgi:hypothetical protein